MNKYKLFRGIELLITGLASIGLNVFSDFILGVNSKTVKYIIGIVILVALVVVVLRYLRNRKLVLDNYRMERLDGEWDKEQNAREGLIILLSKYNRVPRDKDAKSIFFERLKDGDWSLLDFKDSNLGHFVNGILSHKKSLSHCWIITTENTNNDIDGILNGTHVYYGSVTNYLKTILPNVKFHQENIVVTEDSAVTRKVRETVNRILNSKGTPAKTITDVTGGTKSMTLGATLACLQGDRDLQLIGTEYDEIGNIRPGTSFVLLCQFDVKNIE